MWIMTSRPLEENDLFFITMSYSNILDEEDPDNIVSFDSMDDAVLFDVDEFLKDFDWEDYRANYKTKEEKELERGLKQELERGENIQWLLLVDKNLMMRIEL